MDNMSTTAEFVEPGDWTEDSPAFTEQTSGGGEVDDLTFTLPATPDDDNETPRAERRYHDYADGDMNYSTGVRQFSGTFTIGSMGGDKISLKQTFDKEGGPFFLMAVEQGGRLYSVKGGGETIADGVAQVGAAVRVNTVHDTSTHVFRVYINDQLKFTVNDVPDGQYYDKFGAYVTNSGSGDISVTWSDVHFGYM
jgi:hypothetical protein